MVLFFLDSAIIICDINESESGVVMQERFLYCVFNIFSLFDDSLVNIFSIGSELIKDKDRVFHIDFSFLLKFLHSCHDFSGEASDF